MKDSSAFPLFVSLTTIPSRIDHIQPVLDSLLAGELWPERIFVNIPEYSNLENRRYAIPDFLHRSYPDSLVKTNVLKEDFGPGTKVLGPLDLLPSRGALVLCDDDVAYHPSFLRKLADRQVTSPSAAFSYYTYRQGGLTVGQGCDGFSIPCYFLEGLSAFFRQHVQGTTLAYHDDLWISYYLATRNVAIRQIPTPGEGVLVYDQVLPNTVLSALEGDRKREVITATHLERLRRECPLPGHLRAWIGYWRLHDQATRRTDSIVRHLRRLLPWRRATK